MNKVEKKAFDLLEADGYLIEKPVKTAWHRQDFFNLWDMIALKPKEKLRFIQVSVMKRYQGSNYKKDFKGFPIPLCEHISKEYWFFNRKTKEFEITVYE